MKKLKLIMLTGVLALAFVGCKDISCEDATNAVTNSLLELVNNPTDANCNTYKDALRDAINNSDCPNASKDAYQAVLNAGC